MRSLGIVASGRVEPAAGGGFTDSFTGSNGSAWDSAKWNVTTPGTCIVDIQSNEGRQVAQGSNYAETDARSDATFTDIDILVSYRLADTGEQYAAVIARVVDMANYYYALVQPGSNSVAMYKKVAGTPTAIGSSISVTAANMTSKRWIRFQVEGTTLRLREWADGAGEPGSWGATGTDSAFSSAGPVGLVTTNGNATTARTCYWDGFEATPL